MFVPLPAILIWLLTEDECDESASYFDAGFSDRTWRILTWALVLFVVGLFGLVAWMWSKVL